MTLDVESVVGRWLRELREIFGLIPDTHRRRHKEEAGRSKLESPSRCSREREEEDRTLKPKQEPDASSLEGGIIAFTGRLASMKRANAFTLVTQHGGKPCERVTKDTKVLIVGELGWPLQEDGRPSKSLTQAKSYSVPIVSERRFLEWVGKISPEEQAKTYTTDELAALSKLPADVVEQLSMFGLIEVRDGRYGFRDLASARQAAQLLGSGIGLSVITKSLREIRKRIPDARLSNLRLYPELKDRILVEQAQGHTDLKGQFVLPVEKTNHLDADEAFVQAQSAEEADDLLSAESLYRRVMNLIERSGARAGISAISCGFSTARWRRKRPIGGP